MTNAQTKMVMDYMLAWNTKIVAEGDISHRIVSWRTTPKNLFLTLGSGSTVGVKLAEVYNCFRGIDDTKKILDALDNATRQFNLVMETSGLPDYLADVLIDAQKKINDAYEMIEDYLKNNIVKGGK